MSFSIGIPRCSRGSLHNALQTHEGDCYIQEGHTLISYKINTGLKFDDNYKSATTSPNDSGRLYRCTHADKNSNYSYRV